MDRRAPRPIFTAMTEHKTRPERDAGGGEAAGAPDTDPHTDTGSEAATGTAPKGDHSAAAGGGGKGPAQKPGEIGGPKGPEPTRYGDWEVGGRCSDF
jgi:hypothetical protein